MSDIKLIGLYGGAFDPVHNAHIEIAKNCIDEVGLNKLIFDLFLINKLIKITIKRGVLTC